MYAFPDAVEEQKCFGFADNYSKCFDVFSYLASVLHALNQ